MKARFLFLFILSLVMVMGFASSSIQDIGSVSQNSCIQLPQACASCTYNNISSVQYPDKTYALLGNFAMTKTDTNYNLTFCDTSQLGTYTVSGFGDIGGSPTTWSYIFDVSTTGTITTPVQIAIYILFLAFCAFLAYGSVNLIRNNNFGKDKLDFSKMYKERKAGEMGFYFTLLKRKLWIVGVFGIYLSILLFTSIFTQIVYALGLSDLFALFSNASVVILWGTIPFVLFWMAYIIIFLYKSTAETMKYQLGSIGGWR